MDVDNIQVNFANVLWVAFSILSGSLPLVKSQYFFNEPFIIAI
jgi:hypothetical protein